MKLAVVSVTRKGDIIAKTLNETIPLKVYSSYENKSFKLQEICKEVMEEFEGIIFISSTGIAVRGIAPFLRGKDKDPAVVVIDSEGNFAISLLSGHLGGANKLTLEIAKIIGAKPIITTATDNLGIEAPDIIAKENDLVIDNLKLAKNVASLLVDGKNVGFIDEDNKIELPKGYSTKNENLQGLVTITNKIKVENDFKVSKDFHLKLIRRNIVLGMGCRKNVDIFKVRNFVVDTLTKMNIDFRAVKSISTVEVKKDEIALIELSKFLKCPLKIHSLEEIETIEDRYTGSEFVKKTIGVRAVCEPCVELENSKIITNKIAFEGITLCVGICE